MIYLDFLPRLPPETLLKLPSCKIVKETANSLIIAFSGRQIEVIRCSNTRRLFFLIDGKRYRKLYLYKGKWFASKELGVKYVYANMSKAQRAVFTGVKNQILSAIIRNNQLKLF